MKIINLLPKSKQQELRYEAMLKGAWVIFIMSLASFIFVFFVQGSVKIYLSIKANSINNEITELKNQVNKQENAQVKAKVKVINDTISDYKNLAEITPKWSKVITAFAELPPEGIKINNTAIDPVKKSISINGFSAKRELVIELENIIRNDNKDFKIFNYKRSIDTTA